MLEKLYRAKWTAQDGLGALVISPTRELAVQIFEVLRKAGSKHSFSAGLVIGGKDLKSEQERLASMNILICTPGRLLQHMDQTPLFDTNNVQIFSMTFTLFVCFRFPGVLRGNSFCSFSPGRGRQTP